MGAGVNRKQHNKLETGTWQAVVGPIAICHGKERAGNRGDRKTAQKEKNPNWNQHSKVQLKEPRERKEQSEPTFQLYSTGTWKGEWAFISTDWKLIYRQQERLATQKINVRLSLDFWSPLHTFLLSYFSIPLEITGIKGHFKVGLSWKCFIAVLIFHDDRGKTSIHSWDCSCFSF